MQAVLAARREGLVVGRDLDLEALLGAWGGAAVGGDALLHLRGEGYVVVKELAHLRDQVRDGLLRLVLMFLDAQYQQTRPKMS